MEIFNSGRGINMAILKHGKIEHIKRKLHLYVDTDIVVENGLDEDKDIDYEIEENVDGSKPSIRIRIKRLLHKEKEPERGIL